MGGRPGRRHRARSVVGPSRSAVAGRRGHRRRAGGAAPGRCCASAPRSLASALSVAAWAGTAPVRAGAVPRRRHAGHRSRDGRAGRAGEVRAGGHHLEAWAHGAAATALAARQAGERVAVVGTSGPAPADVRRRLAEQHIAGQLQVQRIDDHDDGDGASRAANRVRRALVEGAWPLSPAERALFTGFVLGDDRAEPADLVDDFRASGLSHLTAVSGENLAFALALAGPLLRRLTHRWRFLATVALVAWFAAADPVRAVRAAGQCHGGAGGDGGGAGPAGGHAAAALAGGDGHGAGRPAAGVVGGVVALGRRHRRHRRPGRPDGAAAARPPAAGGGTGRHRRRPDRRGTGVGERVRWPAAGVGAGQPAGRPRRRPADGVGPARRGAGRRWCRRWRRCCTCRPRLAVRWIALVARTGAAAPLGDVGGPGLAVAGVTVGAVAAGRAAWRRRRRR